MRRAGNGGNGTPGEECRAPSAEKRRNRDEGKREEMSERVRSLVTGGAGFLGSHLCDRLIREGHEVICVDNLITGSVDNVAHLFGNDAFRFIKHDVTEYLYVEGRLDYILHFASPASPVDYQRLPIQTLKVGSLGTHKALGLTRAKGARMLLASTSEVYGKLDKPKFSEDDDVVSASTVFSRWRYPAPKALDEYLAQMRADPITRQRILYHKLLIQKFPDQMRISDEEIAAIRTYK